MEVLPDLFCAEGADAVEAEAEDDAVFAAEADVVAEVLHGHVAAIPSVAERPDGTDERVVFARPVLEVEEEGCAAEETVPDVAEKDRRTPLRAFECARLKPACVGELLQRGREFQCARVIESLERLHERTANAEARGEVAPARALHVEVCAHVEEEFVARAIARFDVQGREAAGGGAARETGEGVNWIELIALAGHERAAKILIEEIFAAHGERENFIRLACERRFLRIRGRRRAP